MLSFPIQSSYQALDQLRALFSNQPLSATPFHTKLYVQFCANVSPYHIQDKRKQLGSSRLECRKQLRCSSVYELGPPASHHDRLLVLFTLIVGTQTQPPRTCSHSPPLSQFQLLQPAHPSTATSAPSQPQSLTLECGLTGGVFFWILLANSHATTV